MKLSFPSRIVCELELFSTGEYEVGKFITGWQSFNLRPENGNNVNIKVSASFNNGEKIDTWQNLVLQDIRPTGTSGSPNPLNNVVVNIRGDIKDYSYSVDNYHIYIYQ